MECQGIMLQSEHLAFMNWTEISTYCYNEPEPVENKPNK